MTTKNLYFGSAEYHAILTGQTDLPSNMYIGKTCRNGHGVDGETLRYTSSNHCVYCSQAESRKRSAARIRDRNTKALKAYEAKQEAWKYAHLDDDDVWYGD